MNLTNRRILSLKEKTSKCPAEKKTNPEGEKEGDGAGKVKTVKKAVHSTPLCSFFSQVVHSTPLRTKAKRTWSNTKCYTARRRPKTLWVFASEVAKLTSQKEKHYMLSEGNAHHLCILALTLDLNWIKPYDLTTNSKRM